jgi:hypothetical protein
MSEEGVATLSDIDIDDKSTDGAKTISTAMKIVDCIEQIKANHKYAPNEGYTMRFEDAPLSVCKKCGVVTYISELEDNLCGSCR